VSLFSAANSAAERAEPRHCRGRGLRGKRGDAFFQSADAARDSFNGLRRGRRRRLFGHALEIGQTAAQFLKRAFHRRRALFDGGKIRRLRFGPLLDGGKPLFRFADGGGQFVDAFAESALIGRGRGHRPRGERFDPRRKIGDFAGNSPTRGSATSLRGGISKKTMSAPATTPAAPVSTGMDTMPRQSGAAACARKRSHAALAAAPGACLLAFGFRLFAARRAALPARFGRLQFEHGRTPPAPGLRRSVVPGAAALCHRSSLARPAADGPMLRPRDFARQPITISTMRAAPTHWVLPPLRP
jgi:hypothetical protein